MSVYIDTLAENMIEEIHANGATRDDFLAAIRIAFSEVN